MKGGSHITFVARKDTKWAYDTALGEPVFVGNKDEWDINETRRRNNANRDPWGGVWTEPLVEGATKARFGPATGLYTCCEDEECGVWVIVKQGPENEWHFARDWLNGTTKQHKPENRKLCVNSSNYTGESRFHNVTKRQVYRYLKSKGEYHGKKIIDLRLEESLRVSQSDGSVMTIIPDVFVKFEDETWFAIEVVYKHPPKEEKHKAYKMNMVILDLRDEPVTESDNQFAKWVRDGGVEELLQKETTPARRRERYYERERYWNAENKRKRRARNQQTLSACALEFGYSLALSNHQLETLETEDIRLLFEEEKAKRDLQKAIRAAIERNQEKYETNLVLDGDSVKEVNEAYNKYFEKVNERKKLRKAIDAEVRRCEKEFGFPLPENSTPSGVEEVRPLFKEEKTRREEAQKILNAKIEERIAYCEERYNFSIDEKPRTVQEVDKLFRAKEKALEKAAREAVLTELEDKLGFNAKELGIDHTWTEEEIRDSLEWLKREAEIQRRKEMQYKSQSEIFRIDADRIFHETCSRHPWAEPDLREVSTKPEDYEFSIERYKIAISAKAKQVDYGHAWAAKATEEAHEELTHLISTSPILDPYFSLDLYNLKTQKRTKTSSIPKLEEVMGRIKTLNEKWLIDLALRIEEEEDALIEKRKDTSKVVLELFPDGFLKNVLKEKIDLHDLLFAESTIDETIEGIFANITESRRLIDECEQDLVQIVDLIDAIGHVWIELTYEISERYFSPLINTSPVSEIRRILTKVVASKNPRERIARVLTETQEIFLGLSNHQKALVQLLNRDEEARLKIIHQREVLAVFGIQLRDPHGIRDENGKALITLRGLSTPLSAGYVAYNQMRIMKCLPSLYRKQKYGLKKEDVVFGMDVDKIQAVIDKKRAEDGLDAQKVSWRPPEKGEHSGPRPRRWGRGITMVDPYSLISQAGDEVDMTLRKLEAFVNTVEDLTDAIDDVIQRCQSGDFSVSDIVVFEWPKRIKSLLRTMLVPVDQEYVVDNKDTSSQSHEDRLAELRRKSEALKRQSANRSDDS